jgi:hypothetical protein
MSVVNRIVRGELNPVPNITIEALIPYMSKYYCHKPKMVKYHCRGVTLLIFTSFKFRLMGGGWSHEQILQEFLQQLPFKINVLNLRLSTMTLVHDLKQTINLHKLCPPYFSYEPELFPAAKLIHSGRENVNVFHSGKVVVTGMKDINKFQFYLLPLLSRQLTNATGCGHSISCGQ